LVEKTSANYVILKSGDWSGKTTTNWKWIR